MSDQLFIVLRVCLLALVYLVFLRVLRAVWVELRAEAAVPVGASPGSPPAGRAPSARRPPAPAPPQPAAGTTIPGGATRLVILAPAALAGRSFTLDGETTIGRGAGCGVSIDDAHVSKLHARLSPGGRGWVLEDLGSTNGTVVDGRTIDRPTPIGPGGRITIGELVLELT